MTQLITKIAGKGQPDQFKSFKYLTPIKDEYSGVFVGFTKTEEISESSLGKSRKKIEKQYFKDLAPEAILYKTRARYNGRVERTIVTDISPIQKAKKVRTQSLGRHNLTPPRRDPKELFCCQ